MIDEKRADEIAEAGKALACGGCSLIAALFLLVMLFVVIGGLLFGR